MTYNIRNQKWGDPTRGTESGEIEWSMDLSNGLQMASGFVMSDFTGAMQAAFDKWESVADIDFTYVGGSGGDVDVDMSFLAGSTVGQATWNSGAVINFGRIEMDNEEVWSPFGGSGGESFYAVALHEIGHILGFNHVNDTSEIMNGFVAANDLGDGDIAGAQVLYGVGSATPAPSPTPPSSDPGFSDGDGSDGGSSGGGGIILALLGLLGAIFGFGGAAFAVAAATAAPEDEETAEGDDDDTMAGACGCEGDCTCDAAHSSHDHVHEAEYLPGVGMVYTHNVYLTEEDYLAAELGSHEEEHSHGGCGHDGPCDCHLQTGEQSSGDVLLTDIIPVTGVLEESMCGMPVDDVEEDLLEYV